jgi:hypothetical protein
MGMSTKRGNFTKKHGGMKPTGLREHAYLGFGHAEDAPALENGIINYLVDHPTYIQSVDDQPQS